MRTLKWFALILLTAIRLAGPVGAQILPDSFAFLRDIDSTILQDIRYAGANNFMGRPLAGYGAAECVVKRDVGLALKNVQVELAPQKLSLKMLDCARGARHGAVGAKRPDDAGRAPV
jgi:zinc D-Ala-D-Ala dipeptidase